MNSALRRLNPAISTVALVVALLALVVSAAGVGHAAATIGASDIKKNAVTAAKIKNNAVKTKKIKNNAVTAEKVKDGSLTAADLVAEEKQIAATFGNGGEGDCVWQPASVVIPGLGAPTYRKDTFGTVHLTGVAVVSDGPGGDANCDSSAVGQASDGLAFVLPAGYIPAKTVYMLVGAGIQVIVGAQGLTSGPLTLPPGAVFSEGFVGVVLDNVEFQPAGSNVVIPKMNASGRSSGALLLLG